MRKILRFISIAVLFWTVFPTGIGAQDTFQLAAPFMVYPSVFFEKETKISMEFKQAGTAIHYTTNGRTPSEQDPVYQGPIRVKKHFTILKARSFGTGFLPSETVEAVFYQQGLPIQSISTTLPHERYPGHGNQTLCDGIGGVDPYSSTSWMGFQQDTVRMMVNFAGAIRPKQVLLHVMENQGAWIFLPQKVEVYGAKKGSDDWISMGSFMLNPTEKSGQNGGKALVFDLKKPLKTDRIILKIYPLSNIPDWHPGKGSPAWFFIDEVKLY